MGGFFRNATVGLTDFTKVTISALRIASATRISNISGEVISKARYVAFTEKGGRQGWMVFQTFIQLTGNLSKT